MRQHQDQLAGAGQVKRVRAEGMGGWGRSWNLIQSVGGECKAVSTDITGLDDSRKHHAGY